jgi:hypothetical protein
MAQKNRWDPMMLPDDCIRKMKQDLAEVEAHVESKTRYEPDPTSPLRPTRMTRRLDMRASPATMSAIESGPFQLEEVARR